MKIKLDENLPERLVAELSALVHDVDTVRAERLAGRDDTDVWQVTQAAERFLVTQDLDFSDLRRHGSFSVRLSPRVWPPLVYREQ